MSESLTRRQGPIDDRGGESVHPRSFTESEFSTLASLCSKIIPPDCQSPGAVEAGVPEFLDVLASENDEYQRILAGGIMWLDATCAKLYGDKFLYCTSHQQYEMLHMISSRTFVHPYLRLGAAQTFFVLLKRLTVDGFFTSKFGVSYLEYIGNTFQLEFNGCVLPATTPMTAHVKSGGAR